MAAPKAKGWRGLGRLLWVQGAHLRRRFRNTWVARLLWRARLWCAAGLCKVALRLAGAYGARAEVRLHLGWSGPRRKGRGALQVCGQPGTLLA